MRHIMIIYNLILETKIPKIKSHYFDTDAFVRSIITEYIIEDLKNLGDFFDFSNLNENQELFSYKNKK